MLNVLRNLMSGRSGRNVEATLSPYAGNVGSVSASASLSRDGETAPISPTIFAGAVQALDFTILFLSGLVTALVYLVEPGLATSPRYIAALGATSAAAVMLFRGFGVYQPHRLASMARNLPALAVGWAIAVAALVTVVFLLKAGESFSRAWLVIWYSAGAAGLFISHTALSFTVRSLQRSGRLSRRAVVVGAGPQAHDLMASLSHQEVNDLNIRGVFDDRAARRDDADDGLLSDGSLDDLITFVRRNKIDVILLALPMAAENRILEILRQLSVLPVDIKIAANASRVRFSHRAYSHVGNVAFLDLFDRPIGDWGALCKSAFDKVVAAAAIVALAPVLIATALAVRFTSKGKILFTQERYGFNNELIKIYKFRSMYEDKSDANAVKLVTKDDDRVTPVGRFIRKTSIDELPQLFNVLLGDLSLVGPRPHALQAKAGDRLYQEVVDGYFARHRVKPGITGWAQINGWRGETDTELKIEKRVEHDLYYIENWSLLFDLYILVRTPLALFDTKSAY